MYPAVVLAELNMKTLALLLALLASCAVAQDATNTVAVSDSDTTLTAIAGPAEAAPTNTLALVRVFNATSEQLQKIQAILGIE